MEVIVPLNNDDITNSHINIDLQIMETYSDDSKSEDIFLSDFACDQLTQKVIAINNDLT